MYCTDASYNAFSYFSCYKRKRSIPVIIRGWKMQLDSAFRTARTTSYLLIHVILYLHESKMAPIVKLHCLTTKTEHCRGISFFVCHTWNCVAYLIVYPPPLAIVHSAHSAVGLNIMRTKPLKQMQSERLAKAKRRSCRRGMSFLRAAPNDWRQLAIT